MKKENVAMAISIAFGLLVAPVGVMAMSVGTVEVSLFTLTEANVFLGLASIIFAGLFVFLAKTKGVQMPYYINMAVWTVCLVINLWVGILQPNFFYNPPNLIMVFIAES
jgi:hypothetical protein